MEILSINHKLYLENEKREKVCICVCVYVRDICGYKKVKSSCHKKYILSKTGRFMK